MIDVNQPTAPPVWTWYRVYVGTLALVYLALAAGGVLMATFVPAQPNEPPPWVVGLVLSTLGAVSAAAFIVALFLPRRPWVWVYHLVLIALGMTSTCCIPVCVPLLIFWIKPETRAYFGRT